MILIIMIIMILLIILMMIIMMMVEMHLFDIDWNYKMMKVFFIMFEIIIGNVIFMNM